MKCYNCGKEMKGLKCKECSIVDYQCECGWGSGHSHDHLEVIDSKDLGPTLSALYELDVVKQKLAEKDKEIEELKSKLLSKKCWEFVENIERKNKEYFENPQDIMFCSKNQLEPIIRHQVCEDIRKAFEFWYDDYNIQDIRLWFQMQSFLKLIEQGESE